MVKIDVISVKQDQDNMDLRDFILLDSDSTAHTFFNPSFVHDIIKYDDSMILSSNGGTVKATHKCKVNNLPLDRKLRNSPLMEFIHFPFLLIP